MGHHIDGDTNCNWRTWNSPKGLIMETGRAVNRGTNRDYSSYNIVEISQNSEESPGNLRRLAIAPTPVKNPQHLCEELARSEIIIIIILSFQIRGQVDTIQTTVLLRLARILSRVLETWGDLLSLRLQWQTSCLRWWE